MSQLKIVSWNQLSNNITFLRDLTQEEKSLHDQFSPVFLEAEERLVLFKLLAKNYDEWNTHVQSLLNSTPSDITVARQESNRLLLNYLTFAYTIKEHFEVSLNRRHRKNVAMREEYNTFVDSLCSKSWAFAFISDFRGYVQHVGLAVGLFDRNISMSSVKITIAVDSVELLKESRDWKKSNLKADRGVIDLIEILHDFHQAMLTHYSRQVIKLFYPSLLAASRFYEELTNVVKIVDPKARMVFHLDEPKGTKSSDSISLELNLLMVPNNVFEELGISVK